MQCHEREPDTAVVGSNPAEGQFAIQFYVRDGAEISVLVTRQAARSSNRFASSGVHQSRKLPCGSNWRPSSSKPWVNSCPMTTRSRPYSWHRPTWTEERRLKDTGWKYDFVPRAAVVGVHGGWRHAPLFAVEGLTDLSICRLNRMVHSPEIPTRSPRTISSCVVAAHLRIADLIADRLQLHLGLFLLCRPSSRAKRGCPGPAKLPAPPS